MSEESSRPPKHPNPSTNDAQPIQTASGKRVQVTDQEFAIMLEKAGGFRSRVAKQLGVTVSAVTHRIQRSEYLRDVCRTVEETVLDMAEASLLKAAQNGEPWAVTFILKCKGRKRGWVERQDLVFGSEVDAPPPPFVIELHDPAFVAAEMAKAAAAREAMTIDLAPSEAKVEPVEGHGGPEKAETSGPSGAPSSGGTDNGPSVGATGGGNAAVAANPEVRVPRTPSEAAAMRREREAREGAAQVQPNAARPAFVAPVAFPRR